jgi:molecular chaperone HtpG
MSEETTVPVREFEYKAEMKQLLHLIVHSLYTHPEIFIRELVSNSSDALNKIRFRRLTDNSINNPELELKIEIEVDDKAQTFSITDSGIGMNYDDLISRLGTIASSGTLDFLNKIKEEQKTFDANLIGQFGVGFYSVFMVTDEITVETRHADKGAKSYRWKSLGETKFQVEEIPEIPRGTRISFRLKDEYKEYSLSFQVINILKKYSNFVDFPVYVNKEKVNSVTALWHKSKDDVTTEELNEFYKFISNDFNPPLGHLQLALEGSVNFKALLFIPENAPPSLFQDALEKSVQLYSSKIFIQDNCKELLPDYLRFVKGVVDTEDLPLNISREVTQSSPVMTKIKNLITSKILVLLEEWFDNDRPKYEKFFRNFGSLLKTGVNSDFTNKSKITDLLLFESSEKNKDEYVTLKEYVQKMDSEQKEIYYMLGDHRDIIEKNPNLEFFKKKGIEVLYLTDPVDVFTIPYIFEYEKKQLKSIDKADIDLNLEESTNEKLTDENSKSLLDLFKEILGDKVENVIESKRLVDSAVTLVVGKEGLDPQVEKIMQYMDKNYSLSKKILEVNTSHQLIKNLSKIYIDDKTNPLLRDTMMQLYESALLIEGKLTSIPEFIKRMTEIMTQATGEK